MAEEKQDLLLERLRAEMAGDLKPERALAPAWKRASFLIPLWVGIVYLVLSALGIRADYPVLGPGLAWGAALAQLAGAYLLMAVGLRLVIPGAAVPVGILLLAVVLVMSLHLALAALVFSVSPVLAPVQLQWQVAEVCLLTGLFLGSIPFGAGVLLAVRGLPVRPVWVGVLCGLGGGLAAEAAWRMHCPVSDPGHVLLSHTGGVLALAMAGVLAGLWGLRHRAILKGRG